MAENVVIDRKTDLQTKYSNPCCACMPRVNNTTHNWFFSKLYGRMDIIYVYIIYIYLLGMQAVGSQAGTQTDTRTERRTNRQEETERQKDSQTD